MFKVLVIAYYYPPMGLSGVQRTLKFTKYMSEYGWEPTVLTSTKTGYFAHDYTLLEEVEASKINVVRVGANDLNSVLKKFGTIKIPSEWIRRIYNRIIQSVFIPDNKKSWAKKAAEKAREILSNENFDAIFVTIPPFSSFVEFAKIKKEFNLPLIVDYRDLWYDSYFSFYLTLFHKMAHKKLEYNSLKNANRIIVTNRNIKESLLKNFPFLSFEDVTIIRHGYDAHDFDEINIAPRENKKIIITHSGNFIEYTTPQYLFEAYKLLKKENPEIAAKFELHFVGLLGRNFIGLIKKLKLVSNVKLHGYVNHKESVKKLLESDVLWMMIDNRKNIEAILPGKTLEYAGARKLIFANIPNGAAKIVLEEYKSAIITPPRDIKKIKEGFIQIYEMFSQGEVPAHDEDFVLNHERKCLTQHLTKEFQFLLKT
ncbi:MAG: glycosyltransferase [Ignavibacteriae bacterium]|nr:glycosyltransferase [Ignavibacteriota bacterium]NOG98260.1 glycosyltransferase [Ignavibacteriota bacterium]